MKTMKHNKKRNVGLLYEFLAREAAEAIVDGDEKRARASIKLIKKHFKEGTNLNREFCLFNALLNSYIKPREGSASEVAQKIVESAKRAVLELKWDEIEREKSHLIRDINHTFDATKFYSKRIDEYKSYAAIQMLFNAWRRPVAEIDVVGLMEAEYDLTRHLLKYKKENILEQRDDRIDDLVVGLMVKKTGAKHKSVLSNEQYELMNAYVYSLREGDGSLALNMMEKLRESTIEAIDGFTGTDASIKQKLSEIRTLIDSMPPSLDDAVVTQYMRFAQLKNELAGNK